MKNIATKIREIISLLFSGAVSSCALFVKFSNEIHKFNSNSSIKKDWEKIGEDISAAMYKMRKNNEKQQKK